MIERPASIVGREPPSSVYEVSEKGFVARRVESPVPTTLEAPPRRSCRVLVVEDGLIVAEDMRRRLVALGYLVVGVVGTGEEAISLAGELHPDIILMDVHLHGKTDGIEAAEIIRKDFDIPVIFATAYNDDRTLQRAITANPFGYVVKPLEPRELHTAIEMALHMHHRGRELRHREIESRLTVEVAPDGIFRLDASGQIVTANRRALQMLGAEKSEQLQGVALRELVLPVERERLAAMLQECLHRQSPRSLRLTLLSLDGQQIPAEVSGSGIGRAGTDHDGVVLVLRTPGGRSPECVDAAAPVTRELMQRDALQRVHSSLSCVSSLLSLQSRFMEDESALCSIRESQSRVRALALVFRHISRPESGGTFQVREYVRDLSAALKRTLGSSSHPVRIDVDATPRMISAERAVHCGLLLNELLSMALRGVSARRQPGTIRVDLHANGSGTVHLRVTQEHDGPRPGKPEPVPTSNGGADFSLELVRFLVEELRGSIARIQSPQAGWSVVFPR